MMTELKCDDKNDIMKEIRNAYEYNLVREIYECCKASSYIEAWKKYKTCRESDSVFKEFILEYRLIFANIYFNIRRKAWGPRDVINYIEDSEYNLTLNRNLKKLNIDVNKITMLKECKLSG